MYDVIIVGMGIAGITAGIYAKRAGLKVLMFEKKMVGGTLQKIDKVTNYPGYEQISGIDLSLSLLKQIKNLNIEYKNEDVIKIEIKAEYKKIITPKACYQAKNIIIATGRKPKFLGLENEQDLLGKGISTCATCDGFLYKNEVVAVVGNGNSALTASLYLSRLAKTVYFLHRKNTFNGEKFLVSEVQNTKNIKIVDNVNIVKINKQDGFLESIELDNQKTLKIKGLFIYIGYLPDTKIIDNLNITDEYGNILVNENYETSINGVYACGDCIKKELYQLITAASEGAIAANNIEKKN